MKTTTSTIQLQQSHYIFFVSCLKSFGCSCFFLCFPRRFGWKKTAKKLALSLRRGLQAATQACQSLDVWFTKQRRRGKSRHIVASENVCEILSALICCLPSQNRNGLLTWWDSKRKPFLTFAVGVRARLSMPAWRTSLDVWFASCGVASIALIRCLAWQHRSDLLTWWDSKRKPFLTFAVGVRARLSMPAWRTSLDVWFASWGVASIALIHCLAWQHRSDLLAWWDSKRKPFLTFAVGVRARLSMPAWRTSLDVWFASCGVASIALIRCLAWQHRSDLLTWWDSKRKPFLTFAVGVRARLSMPAWRTSLDVWFASCGVASIALIHCLAWQHRSDLLSWWDSKRKPFLTFAVGVRARLSMPAWRTSLDVWFASCGVASIALIHCLAWQHRSDLLTWWDSKRKPFLTFAVGVRARLSMPTWRTSLDVWFASWGVASIALIRCLAWQHRSDLLTWWDSKRKPFLTFAVGVRARLSMPAWRTSLDVWFASWGVASIALIRCLAWEHRTALLTWWDSKHQPFLTFAVGVRARLSMPTWRTSLDVWFASWGVASIALIRCLAWQHRSDLLAWWDSKRKPFLTFAVGVRARLFMPAWRTSLDVWFASWGVASIALIHCLAWQHRSDLLTWWDSKRKPFLTFAVGVRARLSMPAWRTSLDVWFASWGVASIALFRCLAWQHRSDLLTWWDSKRKPFLTFAVGVRARLSMPAWRTSLDVWFASCGFASIALIRCLAWQHRSDLLAWWDSKRKPFLTFAVGVRARLSMPAWRTSLDVWFAS